MIIIATIVAMALGFVALIVLDNDRPSDSAQDASLNLNQNKEINQLIENYFNAKKTVNIEAMSELVSDSNRIPKDRYTVLASYVENYKDFDCYYIKNEETDSYRVYVKYNMKLKNIESWVPCLTKYYVKVTSEGKYVIYFSALDDVEVEFINSADKNDEIHKLKEEVNKSMTDILEKDATFKQYYQKMQKEIKAASNAAASGAPASSAASASICSPCLPSIIALAIVDAISLTALIASSLPGIT